MGQYYKPTIVGYHGRVRYLESWSYGMGSKLMEHSYVGNKFVNAVCSRIVDCPRPIAWMGDYSEYNHMGDKYESKLKESTFHRRYKQVWGDEKRKYEITPDAMEFDIENADGWYLVNRTTKQYIDLGEYVSLNKWTEHYEDGDYEWCVHPLPLLTACGNGRGGGDYWSSNPDYASVGLWAWDELELTRNKARIPDAYYEKVMFRFKEDFT